MELNLNEIKKELSKFKEEDIIFTRHAGIDRSLGRDLSQETIKYYLLNPELLIDARRGRGKAILLHYNMSRTYELVVVVLILSKKLKVLTEYKRVLRFKRK